MDIKLKVIEGKNAGKEIPVPGQKFFIGRAEDCHLRPNSDMVSRYHCALNIEESYLSIRDFGSKNGTFVNGQRISSEIELKAGDRIKVGPLEFEIHVGHGLGGKKRPPVSDLKEAAARAAAGGSSKDLDVSQWLADESVASAKDAASKDTTRVRLAGTEQVPLGITQEATPAADDLPEAPDASESSEVNAGGKDKKTPGKLPPIPKSAAKDSREAAASILAKLRKRH